MTFATTTLDEGLTVVTERMPDVRSVSIGFWVGTGSVDEAPAQSGASHFLEHLLFKGTADPDAPASIAEAVDAVGGDMNAFTTKEYTAFYVRLLADDLDLGLDIISDIIWSPAFRPDEFESERQVILEEILMHADEPADLVHDVLAGALFPGHPLGREVLGEEATVAAMTRRGRGRLSRRPLPAGQRRGRRRRRPRPRPGRRRTGRPARTAAGAGASPTRTAARPPRRWPGSCWPRPTEQVHLAVAVPAPDRDDEDRHAMSIVEHVLGGGMSSRLFQSIREERGLAYSVYAYRLGFEGAGALAVYAGTAPAHAAEVLDLIGSELDRGGDDGDHRRGARRRPGPRSGCHGPRPRGLRRPDEPHRPQPDWCTAGCSTLEEVEARLPALTSTRSTRWPPAGCPRPRTVACVGPFDGDL